MGGGGRVEEGEVGAEEEGEAAVRATTAATEVSLCTQSGDEVARVSAEKLRRWPASDEREKKDAPPGPLSIFVLELPRRPPPSQWVRIVAVRCCSCFC